MDPDEALAEIRDALAVYYGGQSVSEHLAGVDRQEEAARVLAERFEALDGWLSKGGFLPWAWRR